MGGGAVGTVIARHLAASRAVRRLTLADVNETTLHRLVAELPGRKTRVLRLDASDAAALARACRGAEVVVNATLPRFNGPIQTAAREARAAYIDLASLVSDPFVDDPKWRAAGVPAIVGMGEDPGLSNLMARAAADRMQWVESIRVRDGDTASSPEFPFICLFSPETFIGETLHSSRIWRNGAYETVPPFGEPERYAFPPPVGTCSVYSVDHEEVDTLPRFIGKGVRYVDFKLAMDDRTVRVLQTFQDLQLFDSERADLAAARSAILSAIPKPADLVGKIEGAAVLVVEVEGEDHGGSTRLRLSTGISHVEAARRYRSTGTAYLTGTAGAVGALLLADGSISEPGMHSPESLSPAPFFRALEHRGVRVRRESLPPRGKRRGPGR